MSQTKELMRRAFESLKVAATASCQRKRLKAVEKLNSLTLQELFLLVEEGIGIYSLALQIQGKAESEGRESAKQFAVQRILQLAGFKNLDCLASQAIVYAQTATESIESRLLHVLSLCKGIGVGQSTLARWLCRGQNCKTCKQKVNKVLRDLRQKGLVQVKAYSRGYQYFLKT